MGSSDAESGSEVEKQSESEEERDSETETESETESPLTENEDIDQVFLYNITLHSDPGNPNCMENH